MAKKNSTVYKCSECSAIQARWLGRCPACGSWNTLEEAILDPAAPSLQSNNGEFFEKSKPVPLASIKAQNSTRILSGISEFDRVLGGGATLRSAILLGGEPGIGKSTLLLQVCAGISKNAKSEQKILYVSGEESATQTKSRANRLRLDDSKIEILCTSRLEDVLDAIRALKPILVIIDSIQTIYSLSAGIVPGTVNQLKYCANELLGWVKTHDGVLIMSAHVTKEGLIAGPKSLEHMVDTVISFERTDDEVRFLRATKNRFGSVDELGLFTMEEFGLLPVLEPSVMFVTKRNGDVPPGAATSCVFEGTRAFLVEIQALTVPAKSSISRVYSEKIESARVARVAAVLEKRTGIKFSDQDLYVNVAGGMRLTESAIDAALAAALYSVRTDLPVPENAIIFGELSLAGEICPVRRTKQRIKTARDLGFTQIFCPEQDDGTKKVTDVKDLIRILANKK